MVAGVREDDGDGFVEEAECLQDLGEVWSAVDAAVGMRGDYRYVVFTEVKLVFVARLVGFCLHCQIQDCTRLAHARAAEAIV